MDGVIDGTIGFMPWKINIKPALEFLCKMQMDSVVLPVAAVLSIYYVGRPLICYGFWSPLNLYRFHCVDGAVHPPLRLRASLLSTALSILYEFQLVALTSAMATVQPIWRLDEVCRLFLGTSGWSFFWRRPMTANTSPRAWSALRTILFSHTEERRKGVFVLALYQETIQHAVDVMNGGIGADAHDVWLCCLEIVSRILDQREEEYFEMRYLRLPAMEGTVTQYIEGIQDATFRGSLFLQQYERRRQLE